ncbi:MAG: family 10 glycosylhydrolase [Oscillospiraceae bacterium]|nr:family 10 glycosylhydrolase [Oscillospiraceae bacterium]
MTAVYRKEHMVRRRTYESEPLFNRPRGGPSPSGAKRPRRQVPHKRLRQLPRKRLLHAAALFAVFVLLSGVAPIPSLAPDTVPAVVPAAVHAAAAGEEEFRGVWVATVINLDYPSKGGIGVSALKKEADDIIAGAAALGYNAIVLQVRPSSDAFYKSSLFPWSAYLTGNQGVAPPEGFDPLKYWVEQTHARGMQLHAWINPLRITMGSTSAPQHDVTKLAYANPARRNPEWTVAYRDGKLYFDPGLPEVRRLVIDGVTEILKNYDVDGIQFDDYFYPGDDFKDDASFRRYGAGYSSKADWRRDNVNELIRDTYEAVKAAKKNVVFGVSPIGIWANKSSSQLGSDTRGNESYYSQFADTRKWVKSGWLDYIAPQIYWHIGFSAADYALLLPWWADVVSGTSVKLYIGTAIYRAGQDGSPGDAWYGAEEIARQAALNERYSQVSGVIHFRYNFLTTNQALRDTVSKVFAASKPVSDKPAEPDPKTVMPVPNTKTLAVGRPTGAGTTTGSAAYYILGTCDPSRPLLMNGKPVPDENRSPDGFFGVMASLSKGANAITFTQTGQKNVTTTITYTAATAPGPSKMARAEIPADSVFPKSANEYRQPGETVTLSCTAPIGATVRVTVGGAAYTMTPGSRNAPAGGGIYSTVYTHAYKLPLSNETGKLITIGTPSYTMTYNGASSSRAAGGAIISVTDKAPYYATVKSDFAFVYSGSSTTGGPKNELARGQKDYVTAVTGNGAWVRLRSGGWLQAPDVTLTSEQAPLTAGLSRIEYLTGDKYDRMVMTLGTPTYTELAFDGKTLTFKLTNLSGAPNNIGLPAGSIFESIGVSNRDGTATYRLTLPEGGRLDGYYMSAEAGRLTLNLKRHPVRAAGSKPLLGLHILLDAGHGGTGPGTLGALGPLGAALAEKHLNYYTALKLKAELEARGATVSMTRGGDVDVTLEARVAASRALKPDMFLSIHANSVAESTDSTNIRGLETFYRNAVGKPLSDIVRNTVIGELGYGNRASKEANLYVLRPTWTPSALVETGFMCNAGDFSRLASNSEQTRMAVSLANAIEEFFS